jgi:hypothetical protein
MCEGIRAFLLERGVAVRQGCIVLFEACSAFFTVDVVNGNIGHPRATWRKKARDR